MHTYRVTIASIDEVETSVEAPTPRRAANKLLTQENVSIEDGDTIEVIVQTESGKKYVYNVAGVRSFRFEKAG